MAEMEVEQELVNKCETKPLNDENIVSVSIMSVKEERLEAQQVEMSATPVEHPLQGEMLPLSVAPNAAVPPLKISVRLKARPKKTVRPIYSRLRGKSKCHICGHYVKRSSIGRHVKYVHGEIVIQCTLCKRAFRRPDSARTHMSLFHKISASNSKDYLTDVRKGDLAVEEMPLTRKRIADGSNILRSIVAFNCHDCEETFTSTTLLFEHCKVHRFTVDGKKFRTLKPSKLKFR